MIKRKLYIGISEDDPQKNTYYFESGEGIEKHQLDRLVDALEDSEEMRETVLKMGVTGTRMVHLADGRFYDVVRKTRTTFELQPH